MCFCLPACLPACLPVRPPVLPACLQELFVRPLVLHKARCVEEVHFIRQVRAGALSGTHLWKG